jgi:hypothetical protein
MNDAVVVDVPIAAVVVLVGGFPSSGKDDKRGAASHLTSPRCVLAALHSFLLFPVFPVRGMSEDLPQPWHRLHRPWSPCPLPGALIRSPHELVAPQRGSFRG